MTGVAHTLILARLVIGLTLALAFASKLRDVPAFRDALEDFQVVPRRAVPTVAATVLAAEAATAGLMLTSGWPLAVGFIGAFALLATFSVAIGMAVRRNLRVSCNCFGSATTRVSPIDLARNAAFMLIAATGLWTLAVARDATIPTEHVVLSVPIAAGVVALLVNLRDVVVTLSRPFPVEAP